MPKAEFFASFGLFVRKGFFGADECTNIIREAQISSWQKVKVAHPLEPTERLDEEVRKTLRGRIPEAHRGLVNDHLVSLCPHLEEHFQVSLTGFQEPQLLRYRSGDFFQAHTDSSFAPTDEGHVGPEYLKKRLVSVSVFLNTEAEEAPPDRYAGGSLVFYGLVRDPRARHYGFALQGEAGLLVAFRSDVVHEVTPVTEGERHSIVTWYF